MTTSTIPPDRSAEARTAFSILAALSLCHLLNDTIQSLLPAIYPVLQENYALSFTQIGFLHFVFQFTASLLQPAVGLYTDKRPMFRLSTAGMGASLIGLLILAFASHYWALLVAAMCDRHRLVDLPPRQLAGGAHRLGRPLRLRAVLLPGGRQHRQRARAAARRLSSCCPSASTPSPGSRRWRSSG